MITYFPCVNDIKLAYLLTKDYCNYHFSVIEYKRLLTTVSELDDVHGEIEEGMKRWDDNHLFVRAFAVPEVITQPLTKFGLVEPRNVDLIICVPHLVDAGLATQDPDTFEVKEIGRIGDHFFYHGVEYEILTFIPAARFGNTDLILYYQLHSERYQPETSEFV